MNTDRHRVLAAWVRSFFDAFSTGIIDNGKCPKAEKRQPKNVRKAMLTHYEQVAPAFLDTLFYPLAAMNFSYEETEKLTRDALRDGGDMMSLVHKACGSERLYTLLVSEYKRNFPSLLEGACPPVADHLATLKQDMGDDGMDTDHAIELTVRVVMRGYAQGLRLSGEPTPSFRQASLFRLLLDAMNVLLLDGVADFSACGENLTAMFLKVCGSEHHFNVMTAEMDRTHHEIMG